MVSIAHRGRWQHWCTEAACSTSAYRHQWAKSLWTFEAVHRRTVLLACCRDMSHDGYVLCAAGSALQYSQHKYTVAQVETMQQTVNSIKYTPTFGIYRNGKKVDEVVGKEPQRLEDHLWLHSD